MTSCEMTTNLQTKRKYRCFSSYLNRAVSFHSAHTEPPAASAVRSSSRRSPSFPALVRPFRNVGPPETSIDLSYPQ